MLLFLLFFCGEVFQYEGIEIFKPLDPDLVALNKDGTLWLFDRDQSSILHYDKNGHFVSQFGRKGQGPGEFQIVGKIYFSHGSLWVKDFRGNQIFHQFTPDGTFVESHNPPEDSALLVRGGWFIGTWQPGMNGTPSDPGELFFISGEKKENLLDLRPKGFIIPEKANGFSFSPGPDGKIAFQWNPATDYPEIKLVPGGDLAFLKWPGKFAKVSKLDPKNGKVLDTFEIDHKPLPFNEQWGNTVIEEKNNIEQQGSIKLKFVPDFPEFFPGIRELFVLDDQHIFVSLYTSNPDQQSDIRCLDHSGKLVPSSFSHGDLERIVAIRGDLAWVTTYDDEEAGISRLPLNEVSSFIKEHPIEFEEMPISFRVN